VRLSAGTQEVNYGRLGRRVSRAIAYQRQWHVKSASRAAKRTEHEKKPAKKESEP
jgi:hypothetical protein